MNKTIRILLAGMALQLGCAAAAHAQAWPTRGPIRMIIPLAPGGSTDQAARIIGQALAESIGQQVLPDNRVGANGVVAIEASSKMAPDGYTIIIGSSTTMAANVFLYKSMTVDPIKSFIPVAMLGTIEFAMVAPAEASFKTLPELVALAKAQPGKLSFGYGSTAALLCGELFNAAAGVNITKIGYKGTPQSLTDLAADRIQLVCEPLGTSMPLIRAGKLRAIAITDKNRHVLDRSVPTTIESGVNMLHQTWAGWFVPAGTPREIVTRLSNEFVKIMGRPDVQAKIVETGFTPRQMGTEEFTATHRADFTRMGQIIKAAGIAPE